MDRYVSNNTYSLNLSPLFCTYLHAIGIYASAKYISGDAKLRKEFYKSAASQVDLLKGYVLRTGRERIIKSGWLLRPYKRYSH